MTRTHARMIKTPGWCCLCGMSPMPVSVALPDGCLAHPGCADDPVFRDRLDQHRGPVPVLSQDEEGR